MIGGFEEPDEGAILLGDRDVVGLPPHKRDVNTVFQSYALFPHLSIFENVAFGLRRKGVERTQVKRPRSTRCWSSSASTGSGPQAAAALRRPAAARRAGARARQPPAGAPARRAARRARPEAAQAAPARAEGDPARHRAHVRPRHARPGGGDDDGGHDRGHAPGPDRAARPADRALRAPCDRLRRRLPRRLEPASRHGRRRRTASGSSGRRADRPRSAVHRRGCGRRPPREAPPRRAPRGREHACRHGQGERLRRGRHAVHRHHRRRRCSSSTRRTPTEADRSLQAPSPAQLEPRVHFVVDPQLSDAEEAA